ncbi:hypothetical protein AD428_02660 [Achromobacter sp. DMS1]|uniref:hypothetical protein n=1 Tax=Achromobacter sp. DMS1 TaxID=1688405 RepID=UPI00069E3EA5|nr:hypothetical protein [Achromobacter sp. DMS1]KOF55107.1 hypothetical protein AD428_02660 [Achromobacter sp. DMS1]
MFFLDLEFALSEKITFLRGLQARCCWAAAPAGADADLGEALDLAVAQGHQDFFCRRSVDDIPPLLADVPELAAAWRNGWTCPGRSLVA